MTRRLTRAQALVASELVAYGRELAARAAAQVGDSFTGSSEADALLERDPNAFLIGCLFTQGIPAERAWAGPWLLAQRLGHLDVRRLAVEPGAVAEAVARSPALHRFKNTLGRWIPAMASRLVEDYGADASSIWPSGAEAVEVMERLSAFEGIGRKKAAMTVEILTRHFGIKLTGLARGRVAYDVHVRRVFLRSGLVDHDSPDAVDRAAELACPEAPGTLDLATWLVGRETCRPRSPRCDDCRLGPMCPRRTWLTVDGVGVRRRGTLGAR